MAMVFVLLTFGGWNEAAYISAELKDERRNMVKALVLSIILITLLYLAVNWAYWRGLGLEGMAKSDAIASDLLKARLRAERRDDDLGDGGDRGVDLDQRHDDRRRPHQLRRRPRLAAAVAAGSVGRGTRHPGGGAAAAVRRRPGRWS